MHDHCTVIWVLHPGGGAQYYLVMQYNNTSVRHGKSTIAGNGIVHKYPHVNVVDESVRKLFETCSSEEKQNNSQIVKMYNNLYACVHTKFSRDSLKCASCGLYPCQYCHHLPYILAEVIHKPICISWDYK